MDPVADINVLWPQGWIRRGGSDHTLFGCSRPFLEDHIRRQLSSYPNIQMQAGTKVEQLLVSEDNTRVLGVQLKSSIRDGEAIPHHLYGDLVVDVSGRNSRTPHWLRELGFPQVEESEINPYLGYATRWYRPPHQLELDWKALVVGPRVPHQPRSGMIWPVEEGKWLVLMAGTGKEYPPGDETGFMEFAKTLASSRLYEALKEAEPISEIYLYRNAVNRRCHYERVRPWPEGLVVLGDAVCSFNPYYGQGITVGALGCQLLGQHLKRTQSRRFRGISRPFQQDLARLNQIPWAMAAGADLKWPTTEGDGGVTWWDRQADRYLDQVLALATSDPVAAITLLEVIHMVKPPQALFQPDLVLKVLRQLLRLEHSHPQPDLDPVSPELSVRS